MRLDRTRHGGGIIIYVKRLFIFSPVFLGTPEFECIVLSINCSSSSHSHNSPDFTIALFYRPPNSSNSLLDSLFTVLCNLNVSLFSSFFLLGDFNIDYFCTHTSLFSKLLSVTSSFNLCQVVSEPTRVTHNSCTLIDLAFVSSPSQVLSCCTIPHLANSDHYGLHLTFSIKSSKKHNKSILRKIWKYAEADVDAVSHHLGEVDWDSVLTGDVGTCWENWKVSFLAILHNFIPNLTVKSNNRLPWINKPILQAMRKRKLLFCTARQSGDPSDLALYHCQRNRVISLLRESKQKFFDNLASADSKHFWKSVKALNCTAKEISLQSLSLMARLLLIPALEKRCSLTL